MKFLLIIISISTMLLIASELKIKSNEFTADENSGISIFKGSVNILMGKDELNASKVTVYTDDKHQPTKFVAQGDVSFTLCSENGSIYKGVAGKTIYMPKEKEYHFFRNVHLKQIDEKKEIIGDEVVLKIVEGKAYAKGAKKEPVIMIFKMAEEK